MATRTDRDRLTATVSNIVHHNALTVRDLNTLSSWREMGVSVQGTATLSLGTEFAPAYGTVTASVSASLKTLPRLAAEFSPKMVGFAALRLGEELTAPGRLAVIPRGRFAGDTPTPSAFWLLF